MFLNKKKISSTLIAFLLIYSFATCQSISRSLSFVYIDDLNREVKLNKFPPERIVSLAPNITEILFALGLGDKVVGVTEYCNYPESAQKKNKIGGFINPNIEKIVSLQPDLVIATPDGNPQSVVEKLASLGIPVYCIYPKNIDEVFLSILNIGKICGADTEANQLITSLRQRVTKAISIARKNGAYPKKVFFVLSTDPLITVGAGSFIDNLISLANGTNIAHHTPVKYPHYSMEEVVRSQPDIILVADMTPSLNQNNHSQQTQMQLVQLQYWEKWKESIPAVKNNKVYFINSDLVTRPGPRLVEGLELLVKLINENNKNEKEKK